MEEAREAVQQGRAGAVAQPTLELLGLASGVSELTPHCTRLRFSGGKGGVGGGGGERASAVRPNRRAASRSILVAGGRGAPMLAVVRERVSAKREG